MVVDSTVKRKGNLWKVTTALGHVTETLAYDGAGRPLSVKDANGVITELGREARAMMSSMSQRQIAAGFIVLAPIFSLGCQHLAKAVPTPERPSICEIRDNPDLYLGRNVEIVATYKSDSSFYSFFEDATCREKKNTLTITNRRIYESGDKSVIELVRKGRQICEGHATVCPVSAAVTLQGVIERDEEGVLGINVKRVLSYSY